MPPSRLSWLALALAVACSGCAADRDSPSRVLQQYAAALEEGRTQDAYALLSREARQDLPYAAFERLVRENPGEMKDIATSLLRPVEQSYVTATVTGPDGQVLTLIYEAGAWRIDGSAVDLYSQASPELAVASFVRAFEARRYDILLGFVPDAQLRGLDAQKLKQAWEGEQKQEMQQLVQSLKASLPTAKAEQVGNRATLGYGAGATVELVREAGLWKIEEL